MLFKSIIICSILLLGVCSNANAGAGPKPMSGPYINWTWPAPISSMEAEITFSDDPGDGTPIFISNQFTLVDGNNNYVTGGYIGVQGNVTSIGRKGVMFSLWDATVSTPGSGATCQNFGGEGVGQQCFKAYPWVAGKTYRFRVVNVSGLDYSGYIIDTSTVPATQTFVGKIKSPSQNPEKTSGAPVGIGGDLFQWVEWYGARPGGCAKASPYAKLLWSQPTGNAGAELPTPWATNHYFYSADNYPVDGVYKCHNSLSWADGSNTYTDHGNPGSSTFHQLKSSSGQFVYAAGTEQGCGGGTMRVDSVGARDCSQITRVALPGGKVALQTDSGHYLSCTNGGGSTVMATARGARQNESFVETSVSGKVYYRSASGHYLTAVNGGGSVLRCDGTSAGAHQGFVSLLNAAPLASVTTSSESPEYGQYGVKAVDGYVNGTPYDSVREWVALNEGVGAWIELRWNNPIVVSSVTLYDRPDVNYQILAGTMVFSDGSSVAVGALPNDASTGRSVSFTPREITSVNFRVDNSNSEYIGLAEFQVWAGGALPPVWPCSEYLSTNTQHVSAGRAVATTSGRWWAPTTTYTAKGSNDNLGTVGSSQRTLSETSEGYFVLGSCPADGDIPVITSISGVVSGTTFTATGTVIDEGNNLARVEMTITGRSSPIACTGTTSFSCRATGLANGNYQASVIATDSVGKVSAARTVDFSVGQTTACVSASNGSHASANRAVLKYGILYYSTGGNDYLGSSASAVSILKETSANVWKKVTSCN